MDISKVELLVNKIDKLSNFDTKRVIKLFIDSALEYGLNVIHIDDFKYNTKKEIPYLEFSTLKKVNLGKLKKIIQKYL